jgi:predicted GH43/DUF377 family glycosyl hydrolase
VFVAEAVGPGMRWEKQGRIFTAANQHEWMAHHASAPIADKVDDRVLRIYFGPRDRQGRTRPAFIEVEADNPANVLYVHDRPLLDLGKPGTFDDSGVTPSCIVNDGDRKYLYYTGWNLGVTVPYTQAVGLAVSTDGGVTFSRMFEGPIVDRTIHEAYSSLSPFVLKTGDTWRLWYGSTTGHVEVRGKLEPQYQIKYADSRDGLEWRRPGATCISYGFESEANGRPCVIEEDGQYRMWYCYRSIVDYRTDRSKSYRIGYAESQNGVDWVRLDDQAGIEPSADGWDSMMVAYPYVYKHRGRTYMLYVGNGFSESGFGYAVLADDNRGRR